MRLGPSDRPFSGRQSGSLNQEAPVRGYECVQCLVVGPDLRPERLASAAEISSAPRLVSPRVVYELPVGVDGAAMSGATRVILLRVLQDTREGVT
jgi:hypothetical protein